MDFNCSFDRFRNLCTELGEVKADYVRAAISTLQFEADGVVTNVHRDITATIKKFDFLIDSGLQGFETHLEIKGPIRSEIRKVNGLGPSITKQGKKIGFKIRSQVDYWFNPEPDKLGLTCPETRNYVVVAVDYFDVPVFEKPAIQAAIEHNLQHQPVPIYINNIYNR